MHCTNYITNYLCFVKLIFVSYILFLNCAPLLGAIEYQRLRISTQAEWQPF
jgi:hypothetical protein